MTPLVAVFTTKYGSRRGFVVVIHPKHKFNTGHLIAPAWAVQQLNQGLGEDVTHSLSFNKVTFVTPFIRKSNWAFVNTCLPIAAVWLDKFCNITWPNQLQAKVKIQYPYNKKSITAFSKADLLDMCLKKKWNSLVWSCYEK